VLRRFLQNTAISAVAYGLAGVLGLFAVGVIARSYGVAVLGLIVLVRAFLPSGFLALTDFGVSEITIQAVSGGRVGDWVAAGEKVSFLTLIAGSTGIISGIALWITSGWLAIVFKVAPDQVEACIAILQVTALMLPLAFLGLVVEGVLKGFEHYGWLRATEVGGNAAYVVAVYGCVWYRTPFEWIAYSYLATIVAKYLVLTAIAYGAAYRTPLRFRAWTLPVRRDVIHRCWLMFNNRITGVLQQTLIPLAIGALFGPAEVGTFDLITRLPRFLKATMAPLYAAILPISTQIEETTDTRRLQMLGRNGLVLPAAIVFPVLISVALFAKEILIVWVGTQHADQWPWLALSLFIPAITVMLGTAQTALMVRSDFLQFNTRLLYLQVVTQYLVTLIFVAWLRERAFILGWVISYVIFAPVIARYMLAAMSLPESLFWEQVCRHLILAAILAAGVGAYKVFSSPPGLIGLAIAGGTCCIVGWILSAGIVLSRSDRAMFGTFLKAMTKRQVKPHDAVKQ
jgi:O-antigen/teichoic acid export membrane protein